MTKITDYLERTEIELSEWKEQLGDKFPSFLNHVLAARLIAALERVEFLDKVSGVMK